jgi:type IV secretory pathway TrbL component
VGFLPAREAATDLAEELAEEVEQVPGRGSGSARARVAVAVADAAPAAATRSAWAEAETKSQSPVLCAASRSEKGLFLALWGMELGRKVRESQKDSEL